MTTQRPDLYAALGLTPQATADQIRHAYRDLVRRHHPDTRGHTQPVQGEDSDAVLQRALAAYAVLGDAQRRADYDTGATGRTRTQPPHAAPVRPPNSTAQPPIRVGPVRWHRWPS